MNLPKLSLPVHNPINQCQSKGGEKCDRFFGEVGIKFQPEKDVPGLKWDCKQYRKADFFLPNFNIYVEFFGMRSIAAREEYCIKNVLAP